MKEEIAKEQEKQQKEIELLTLQQEINKIENEKIEIEKRIRQISSETLGSFFTEQVSEKYPTEYQTFKQQEEQARNHRSSYAKITDLKEKFNEVSQDLQFYQGALPVYESFYQRFEQMKTERQQAQVDEREQERIYNLIHKAENERLQRSRSLYTAWDLGNKTIPPEYQGMTYEQVEAILNQKGAEEKQRQEAKATRDELIGKAIRKDLNVPEDYHLSQIQIQNLSQQFAGYSDDELREFTSDVKKQETTPEGKQETSTPTTSYNEFEKNLVDFIERKNFSLGKVAEVLSVTGYPDPTFEVKFEDGTIHKITITHEEEMNLNVPKKESKLLIEKEQKHDLEQSKQNLINQIITAMTNAGEFNFGDPLNIIGKMNAMENVKNNLNAKTIEELQFILSIYSDSYEKTESNGMHI